jgi:hypothetical protein
MNIFQMLLNTSVLLSLFLSYTHTFLCSGPLGKVLKFKTINPPSDTESDCMVEECDYDLIEEFESGGTDDLALAGLLVKLRICENCRQIYYYYH